MCDRFERGGEKWGESGGDLSGSCVLLAKNLPRARECVLRVFTAIRVAEGAARSVAVSPYRFLCNYN